MEKDNNNYDDDKDGDKGEFRVIFAIFAIMWLVFILGLTFMPLMNNI
jgi:hypothetical protein